MTTLLRIELTVLAILITGCSILSINRKKLNIQYSLPWIVISIGVLVIAIFPGLVEWACSVMEIEKPVNLVFLLAICAVLLLTYHHEKVISRQTNQIRRLSQMLSIQEYEKQLLLSEMMENGKPASEQKQLQKTQDLGEGT